MVSYPIRIRRSSYRGSDSKKAAKAKEEDAAAARLEQHVIALLLRQRNPSAIYSFNTISIDAGVDIELGRRIMIATFGPSNGFTAQPPNIRERREMAFMLGARSNTPCKACGGLGVETKGYDIVPAATVPAIPPELPCETCAGTGFSTSG